MNLFKISSTLKLEMCFPNPFVCIFKVYNSNNNNNNNNVWKVAVILHDVGVRTKFHDRYDCY